VSDTPLSRDEGWMSQALALADEAEALGEVPVAALVVIGDTIVGRGYNRNILDRDPSAHAEIVALRAAGLALGNHRLVDATLYCTLEPCLMCVGAMLHARIARLVYAADDPKTGAAGSVFDLLGDVRHNHRIAIERGVLAEAAGERLRTFFRGKRLEEKERKTRG
jgi:tRNA(Arg) A34 adenosine deaminase TadA